MARPRQWTCQRSTGGLVCKHRNPSIKRKCQKCDKPRPARKRPAHMAAMDVDYEGFIALNGGEFCAICKRKPSKVRRLDRDHDHETGQPRGLLCARCNRALPNWVSVEWLQGAAAYISRKVPVDG